MSLAKAFVRRTAKRLGVAMPIYEAHGGMIRPANSANLIAVAPGAVICECGWEAESYDQRQLEKDFRDHHGSGEHKLRMSRPEFDEDLFDRVTRSRGLHPVGEDGLHHSLTIRDGLCAPLCGATGAGPLSSNWRLVGCYACRGCK